MKPALAILALFGVVTGPVALADTVTVSGVGQVACTVWNEAHQAGDEVSLLALTSWTQGYLTADHDHWVAVGNPPYLSAELSSDRIEAYIGRFCTEYPDEAILAATQALVYELHRQARSAERPD